MRALPKHLASLPQRDGGWYVIMTRDHCWGRGGTLQIACTQARWAGARSLAADNVIVWWAPLAADPCIDELGRICWKSTSLKGQPREGPELLHVPKAKTCLCPICRHKHDPNDVCPGEQAT